MSGFTRRDVLTLGGVAAAAGVGFPAVLKAQQKDVIMLGLWSFTGAFSDVGPVLDRGMKLALDERGMKVQGKPIKYITRDDETKAGSATRRAEEAIDADGVKYIIGPWSSGVALAVSEVAKRKKTFHYFIGWSVEKYVKEVGKGHGIEFVGADRHPLGEREFSNYVTKAAGNKPDVVVMINFGLDAVTGVREIFNFGLTPKLPLIMTWSSGVEELVQLAPEIRENLWVGSNFYYTADTPVAREFVKSYQTKFGGPPGYAPAAAYGMTRMTLAAMDKAKSTEVADVVKACEGLEVDDLVGRMRVDPKTHQTLRPYFFMRCKKKDAMKGPMDFADIIATGSTPLPVEYAACKDIGSL